MTTIETVEIRQVDLQPKVRRTDAIQSFVVQETVLVTIRCSDGSVGTGYTYTIGTGGSSIVALLHDHLAPLLIGRNPAEYESIWRDLFFHTHATAVGAITGLALAAVDTALWDRNTRVAGLPLWIAAGGAKLKVGRPHVSEDAARLTAVRSAVGDGFELMVDANQGFTLAEALRRAHAFEPLRLAWLGEPMPPESPHRHRR